MIYFFDCDDFDFDDFDFDDFDFDDFDCDDCDDCDCDDCDDCDGNIGNDFGFINLECKIDNNDAISVSISV